MSTELAEIGEEIVGKKVDKATERRYKRAVQELSWLLENWEKVVSTTLSNRPVWKKELQRLSEAKKGFFEGWGSEALIREVAIVENRLGMRKMLEPLEKRVERKERVALETRSSMEVQREEKRKKFREKRRAVRARLGRYCFGRNYNKLSFCHFS